MTETALVMRTTGSWYKLLTPDGEWLDGRLRGRYRLQGSKQTNPVAVGDEVLLSRQSDGTVVIDDICDRRNCIIRRSTKLSKQAHVIAANIDLLCLVATLGVPRTSTGFIDRMLATAEAYHVPAVLVFNKCDLYDSERREQLRELRALYEGVGYKVLEVSALTGDGMEQLREMLRDKVTLFSGHSGVGKSAMLNALDPSLNLRVGELSDWSNKGCHTTTFAEIFPMALSDGSKAYVIDTPGIKEFGLVGITREELSHFFPEMRRVLPGCHFSTCTHTHEPHCAVKEAVNEGTIPIERYTNYLAILESL